MGSLFNFSTGPSSAQISEQNDLNSVNAALAQNAQTQAGREADLLRTSNAAKAQADQQRARQFASAQQAQSSLQARTRSAAVGTLLGGSGSITNTLLGNGNGSPGTFLGVG